MDKPFSGLKVLGIILLIVVVLSAIYYAVVFGIVDTIVNFFINLGKTVVEGVKQWLKSVKAFFGISVVTEGMYIRPISQEAIDGLKAELEGQAVDTDNSGITEEMIRKMLLVEATTSSTVDTLCVAEIEPIEILQSAKDYKDKEDLESNVNNYLYQYFNSLKSKSSKSNVWPSDVKYNYTLYFITDTLYYFKDEKDMIGNGNDKYYLATMGSIKIVSESGKELNFVSRQEFEDIRSRYESHPDWDQYKEDLLYHYTIDDSGELAVHKVIDNINSYEYIFRQNDNFKFAKGREDKKTSSNSVEEFTADIQNTVESSLYNVSIELLMNFLDLTGSPEYVDKFIDYALDNTEVTITAYSIETGEKSYDIDTYNIEKDYIYEVFDMVDGGVDIGKDNMKLYKSLIYNREYPKGHPFTGSVVDLKDFEKIDYGSANLVNAFSRFVRLLAMMNGTEDTQPALKEYYETAGFATKEELANYFKTANVGANSFIDSFVEFLGFFGINVDDSNKMIDDFAAYIFEGDAAIQSVKPISKYLKTAYDPGSGFNLGEIEVQEITINTKYETSWQFYATNISTWYGNIEYNNINKTREYTINEEIVAKSEFDKLNPEIDGDHPINYKPIVESKYAKSKDLALDEITKVLIYEARENELKSTGEGIEGEDNVQVVAGLDPQGDIFSDILNLNGFRNIFGDLKAEKKEDYFKYWTLAGLGEIATEDNGNYNSKTGGGSGSDYLYIKYTPTNGKDYETIKKAYYDVIEITTVLPTVSVTKVEKFLALWKNETGTIGDTNYNSNGKLVAYDDIYNGKTKVGDIFESAPEMTFDLLESSDSTKGLVNIFKYIMYKYTGTDYGITDEAQISFMFDTNTCGTSAIWHDDITRQEFIDLVKSYKVPKGKGAYGTLEWGYNKYFIPNAGNFYDIATKYGLDPRFIFSIGIHESAYGTSRIANEKGNFFGWGANDSNPYGNASSFYDMSNGIETVCKGLANNYVSPNGEWYQWIIEKGYDPTTVEGIGCRYASDTNWANCVKGYMKSIFNYYPSLSQFNRRLFNSS